ncbi:MAG TPA: hypothetical protein DCM40_36870 [Maribacter sp.]|nr:hypothetical protein [Maribacter sp.]|tara:strand:+ start:4630 stop:4860 length:231 start_codon:yes stop_codon:yes gene_type:complete
MSNKQLKVGDLVEVRRVSYDQNGEVWRWQEAALVIEVVCGDFVRVVFLDNTTDTVKKSDCFYYKEAYDAFVCSNKA